MIMEFEGRISKVLPTRTGKRQDGTEWKALPFVFEFFENETDRYPDSVLLETLDHDLMRKIGMFVVRGADKKAVIRDGCCELNAEIKCRCGFSHRVSTYERRDGSGKAMMNNLRPYKLEILPTADAAGTAATQQGAMMPPVQAQMPWPQQAQNGQAQQGQGFAQGQEEIDDLPF